MAERRSILANLSALVAGQAIALMLGLVTHAVLARAVGPQDYGILGFAVAVLSYFGLMATLGTDSWATREIAAAPTRSGEISAQVVSLRFALSAVAFVGVVILVATWDQSATVGTVVLIQSAGLFTAALTVDFAFQGLERMDAVARRLVASALIALAGVTAVLSMGGGIVAAAVVLQAAALAAALIMAGELIGLVGLPSIGKGTLAGWCRMVREAAPLAITALVATIYTSIDIVMLGFLRPGDEVGFYVAAVRVLTIGLAVPAVFRTAFAPVLARLTDRLSERQDAGRHHASAVATSGGLGAVLGFVFAPEILNVIYGEAFAPATAVLRILMANLILACTVEVFHTQLVAWRLQKQQMWIMLVGAACNVGLNLAVIPTYGMEGAAATTLASTFIVLFLAAIALRRGGFEIHIGVMARPVVLAMALAAVGYGAASQITGGPALARIIVGSLALAAVYALAVRLTGVFRLGETLRYFSGRP